jgi:hypothetical protein
MTNTEKFKTTYSAAFIDCYPALPAAASAGLIEKALGAALKNIRAVNIDGAAFKETCKRLGIKHTYKAIEEFLA